MWRLFHALFFHSQALNCDFLLSIQMNAIKEISAQLRWVIASSYFCAWSQLEASANCLALIIDKCLPISISSLVLEGKKGKSLVLQLFFCSQYSNGFHLEALRRMNIGRQVWDKKCFKNSWEKYFIIFCLLQQIVI